MAGKKLGISEFFRGKNVFITGASGFLGKVVLHKLLDTAPDVGEVFLLLRAKRGVAPADRLRQILNAVIFDEIRRSNPVLLERVHCVVGDVTEPGLAISDEDVDVLTAKTNVVFHAAADVTFDRLLSEAFNLNVEGTRRMLDLAKKMENLETFLHVSTAYSYCNKRHIDDHLYSDPSLNGFSIEYFQEKEKDPTFDRKKFVGTWPNTYCFTKAITEQMVAEYGDAVPIAIVRPSIIMGAVRDPVPGWAEGLHGMNGCVVGCGTAFVDSMKGDGANLADLIPVDIVSNMMIAAAVERARAGNSNNNVAGGSGKKGAAIDASPSSTDVIPVYNCVSGPYSPVSWNELVNMVSYWSTVHPYENVLWVPAWRFFSTALANRTNLFLRTGVPSFVLDLVTRMVGARPKYLKMYDRFLKVDDVLTYFVSHEWKWKSNTTRRLLNCMSEEERKTYNFDLTGHDWSTYIEQVVRGARAYLLRQDPSTLPRARKRLDNIRRVRDLTLLTFTAGPAYWVINYHLRKSGSSLPASLLSLLQYLYRLILMPSAAAKTLLTTSLRRIASTRPMAVTMK